MDNQTAYKSGQASAGYAIGGPSGMSTAAPPPPSFAQQVDLARNLVSEMVVRLGRLADKLCGAVPTANGEVSNPTLGHGGGVFGGVDNDAQSIQRLMGEAASYLRRIENALPITD